ncbi:MAG: hypothetical protein FWE47_00330 [Oscillospiraceae bacterium]|nr:hypothetical protein [Oscillospiraceae bacterium]
MRKFKLAVTTLAAGLFLSPTPCKGPMQRTPEQIKLVQTSEIDLNYIYSSRFIAFEYDGLEVGEVGYVLSKDTRTGLYDIDIYEKTKGRVNIFKLHFDKGFSYRETPTKHIENSEAETVSWKRKKEEEYPLYYISYRQSFYNPDVKDYNYLFTVRGISPKDQFSISLGNSQISGDGFYKSWRTETRQEYTHGFSMKFETITENILRHKMEINTRLRLEKVMCDTVVAKPFIR